MKKKLLLDILLTVVFLFVVVLSRVIEINGVLAIACGFFVSVLLFIILMMFIVSSVISTYCISILAVFLWGICIDTLFYDDFCELSVNESIATVVIPLILSFIFTTLTVLARIIKIKKTKCKAKAIELIIMFVVIMICLFLIFTSVLNYLGYMFVGAGSVEILVEIDEYLYSHHGEYMGDRKNVYAGHCVDYDIHFEEIKIKESYDVKVGDIISVKYFDGLFGGSYKIQYEKLSVK